MLLGMLFIVGCAGAESEVRDRYVSYRLVFKSAAGVASARKALNANDQILGEGTHVEKIDAAENDKTLLIQFMQPESISSDDAKKKLKALPEVESAEIY